ncbi:non-canonical purine NTP pyrophosphatase, partial [Bifidobacteriaceae bacterium GH022]
MKLVVATHNEGKLVEIKRILSEEFAEISERIELVTAGSLGLPDPVETGVTFEQNALIKA